MATKKPKTSSKSQTKAKSTKSKTAAEDAKKPVTEAVKTNTIEETQTKTEETKAEETKTEEAKVKEVSASTVTSKDKAGFKNFFAKKYEGTESILTIFKNSKFYGSLVGEAIGSMFITLLLFSLSLMGIASVATYSFTVLAIFIAIYAFSGACLNPIITVGMMATRRISVIRGVMYIIAEILGAWLGWLIFNAFHLAGGDSAYEIPAMAEIAEGKFWIITLIELFGACVIGFFFARALKYKRSVFTFGAIVAGGLALAVVVGYVVSAAFLGLNNNFIYNPATALMLQIFPTSGENFGEIFGGICQALAAYALFPMIGGVIGFYLSDFAARLSGSED